MPSDIETLCSCEDETHLSTVQVDIDSDEAPWESTWIDTGGEG